MMSPKAIYALKIVGGSLIAATIFNAIYAAVTGGNISGLEVARNTVGFVLGFLVAAYLHHKGPFAILFHSACREAKEFYMRVRQRTIKENSIAVVRTVSRYPMSYPLVLLFLIGSMVPDSNEIPETAKTIHDVAYRGGTVWLIVWLTITSITMVRVESSAKAVHPLRIIGGFFNRFVLWMLCLMLVRCFGQELSELVIWVIDNPDSSLSVFAGLLILYWAFSMAPKVRSEGYAAEYGYGVAAGKGIRIQRAPADIRRTAIHEAGHVLLYAALPEAPDGLSVKIETELGPFDRLRGYVTNPLPCPDVFTENYLRWSMLKHLAGSVAEMVLLYERADGSCSDNRNWLSAATFYLTSGFGEVFYVEAMNDSQIAHNRLVLNALKASHESDLREFLLANKSILQELADLISQKLELDRTAIAPFLKRVTFTDRLPRYASTN